MKKRALICTTLNDSSLPLFLTDKINRELLIDTCFISDDKDYLRDKLSLNSYDYLYIRDPFTDNKIEIQEIVDKIDLILNSRQKVRLIDNISNIQDIFFEDKWEQYRLFKDLMPKTELLQKENTGELIFKKRISSRSKGIFFKQDDIKNNFNDYITQEKIKIDKEYRVFVIFGEAVKIVGIKNPKTEISASKVIGSEKIGKELEDITKTVMNRVNFHFIGIDVAKTIDEKYFLLEINRSCQFNKFYELTGLNLAEVFVSKLIKFV